MSASLAAEAQIVRAYAAAIREAFGPLLSGPEPAAELARSLLGLAESVVSCAEATASAQQDIEELLRALEPPKPRPTLRVIDGDKL